MEQIDTLRPNDKVTITIWGPDNQNLYKFEGTGFHNLGEALNQAYEDSNISIPAEDCVFEITNDTTGVSHKYRLNAHGHIKLII